MRAIALTILAAVAMGNGDYLDATHHSDSAFFFILFGSTLFSAALIAVIWDKYRKVCELEEIIQVQEHTITLLSNTLQLVKEMQKTAKIDRFAVAKLIGILQPMYAIPEDDPKCRAESDAIGEKVIEKLKAEYEALNEHHHTN